MISATVICDSIGPHSPRLVTMRTVAPKFIHQEELRHRMFSFSVSSARAIPFKKLVSEAKNPVSQARPVIWGAEQKGMSPGDELSDDKTSWFYKRNNCSERERAHDLWENAAYHATRYAELMADLGVHKSIVNRIIEPYIHVHVLRTATEPSWMNFFGLRLDKAADPTLRALAEEMWKAWNESRPKLLQPGEWHLPFTDVLEFPSHMGGLEIDLQTCMIRTSVARCARLSYDSFETGKRSTIEEDLKLYDRLVGSKPLHASPAEHQATPDMLYDVDIEPLWGSPELHGNLLGWQQYRKMLPGESLAPLPEGYKA